MMDENVFVPVRVSDPAGTEMRGWLDVAYVDVQDNCIPVSVRVPDATLTSVFPDANCPAMVIMNWLRVRAVYMTVIIDALMEVPLNETFPLSDAAQDVRRMEYCDEDDPVLERPVFNEECAVPPLRMIAV